ncbi:hypothetical protein [Amycolatopsis sp. cmx-4-83]|uniref:hypothetical protein n=1 Tax=Amycolatopsis sp. cmx-4-83 TaxID=2790940 RepID=UPI00397AECAB
MSEPQPRILPPGTWIDISAGDGEETYVPIKPGTGKALLAQVAELVQRMREQDDQQQ